VSQLTETMFIIEYWF